MLVQDAHEPFHLARTGIGSSAVVGTGHSRIILQDPTSTGSRFTAFPLLSDMTSDSLLDGHLHRHCGGRYARASESVTIRVSGMLAVVDRTFFRCDRCGDERRTVEQRELAEQAAVAAMRDEHGLLKPKEIRQRRERIGITTAQFGDLLFGVPQGIVAGWEKGRYLQNPQVDALIRSLDDPEMLAYRATRGGVTLPQSSGSQGVDNGTAAIDGDSSVEGLVEADALSSSGEA